MLVSTVQWNESAICIHISPLFWISFTFRSPQSTEHILINYLLIHISVQMSIPVSSLTTPCPQPLGLRGWRVAQTTVLHPRQPAGSTCTALLPGRALGLWAAVAWSQLEGVILGLGSFFLTGEESMTPEESMGRIYDPEESITTEINRRGVGCCCFFPDFY